MRQIVAVKWMPCSSSWSSRGKGGPEKRNKETTKPKKRSTRLKYYYVSQMATSLFTCTKYKNSFDKGTFNAANSFHCVTKLSLRFVYHPRVCVSVSVSACVLPFVYHCFFHWTIKKKHRPNPIDNRDEGGARGSLAWIGIGKVSSLRVTYSRTRIRDPRAYVSLAAKTMQTGRTMWRAIGVHVPIPCRFVVGFFFLTSLIFYSFG